MKTVLYIEDNTANVELVRRYLNGTQFRFLEAYDGGQGITLAVEHQPDIILVDIYLPDINGLEVAERLRAIGNFAQTPLIAITTDDRPEMRADAMNSGFDDFLSKPFSAMTLLNLLNQIA